MPELSFFERAIIGGCVDAIKRDRATETQRLEALKFLTQHDDGHWGAHATQALKIHMERAVERLRDVVTPKPMITLRPLAKGQVVTTSDVMGFGAVWFGNQQRGKA